MKGLYRASNTLYYILVQSSFIIGRRGDYYVGIAAGAALPFGVVLVISFPPELPMLAGIAFFVSILLSFVAGFMASFLAGELESGEVVLYLSTPLRKELYMVSWIVAMALAPSLIYIIGFATPLLVIAPAALLSADLWRLTASLALQLFYHSTLFTAVAMVLKSRGKSSLAIVFILIALPFLISMGLLLYNTVFGGSVSSDMLFKLIGLVYPALLYFGGNMAFIPSDFLVELMYTIAVTAVLVIVMIVYSRKRMEV